MKRTASISLVILMIFISFVAMIPISAVNELKIDWTQLNYMAYDEYENEIDEGVIFDNFTCSI